MNNTHNTERFHIGNGVSHLEYGIGVVKCYSGATSYCVLFDGRTDWVTVESKELTSVPSRGEYRRFPRRR